MASFEFRTNTDWLERIGGKTLPREEPKIYPMGNALGQKKQAITPSQGLNNRVLQQPELMLDMKSSHRSTPFPEDNAPVREVPVSAPTRRQKNPLRDAPQATQRPTTENNPYSVEMIRGLNRTVKDYAAGEDGGWGELARTRDYQKIPGMGERLAYDSTDPAYDPGLKYQQDQEHALALERMKGGTDIATARINAQGYVDSAKARAGSAGGSENLLQLRQKAASAGQDAIDRAQKMGIFGEELNQIGRTEQAKSLLYQLGAEPLVDETTGNIYGRTSNGRILNEFGQDITELMAQDIQDQRKRQKTILESFNDYE